jgi:hypothetical protein
MIQHPLAPSMIEVFAAAGLGAAYGADNRAVTLFIHAYLRPRDMNLRQVAISMIPRQF